MVAGPGIAANASRAEVVSRCDLLSTFCQWAGVETPQAIDGSSLVPLSSGRVEALERPVDRLLFHWPHCGRGARGVPTSALIVKDNKLIKFWDQERYELYSLARDIDEQDNLALRELQRLKSMAVALEKRFWSV